MVTGAKYLTVGVLAFLLGGASFHYLRPGDSAKRPMAIEEFAIDGMSCEGCMATVTAALKAVPGVEAAKVSLPEKKAIVVGDPSQIKAEQIEAAVASAGYKARPIAADSALRAKVDNSDKTRGTPRHQPQQ